MSVLLQRDAALTLLKKHIKNKNLIKHCIATEAVMKKLAKRLAQDELLWGITGLIHDIDLELTQNTLSKHAIVGAEMLKEHDFPEVGIKAVLAHNGDILNIKRETTFDFVLTSAETITGLIVATALVCPDKKLKSVEASSVKKRMKEKRFAENVNRDNIMLCEKVGITLDEFISLSLDAMCGIAEELGL